MKELGHYVRNKPENLVWNSAEYPIREVTYAVTSCDVFNEVVMGLYTNVGINIINPLLNSLRDSALQTTNM